MTPFVSIACTTFNHASYIHQCLDGFLMQQTNFEFEIVINDDASTDNTIAILKDYAHRYPGKFNLNIQAENQYSKGVRGMMARFNYPRCKGKYIALCEGDDYWTDPLKLQKQIDFLEAHPDYVFSMGKVHFYYEATQKLLPKTELINVEEHDTFTLKDYLKQPFSQTSTFVFRNPFKPLPPFMYEVMAGDQSLVVAIVGKQGKIKFHNNFFSVYRVNTHSLMQTNLIKVLQANNNMFKAWNEFLDFEYNGLLKSRILENRIVYYLFKPKFMQKLYKNPTVEGILLFVYRGIMKVKNLFTKK